MRVNRPYSAVDVIRLIRELPPDQLSGLMEKLPELSAELCPAKALIPKSVVLQHEDAAEESQLEAIRYFMRWRQEQEKLSKIKVGRPVDKTRLTLLCIAYIWRNDRRHSWNDILEIINGLCKGYRFSCTDSLREPIRKAQKTDAFKIELERIRKIDQAVREGRYPPSTGG